MALRALVTDCHLSQRCRSTWRCDEILEVVDEWNTHRIRKNAGGGGIGGRPVSLYNLPDVYGTQDFKHTIGRDDIDICAELNRSADRLPCDKEMFELANLYMTENNLSQPKNPFDAVNIYYLLRNLIRNDLS